MSRMGLKRTPKVNTALDGYKPRPLGVKEEKFCLQFVITDDRRLSYERAGYLATAPNVQSASISRMLKQPKIKDRIEELRTELLLAQGVTKERVTANLAEIAFEKKNTKADRTRALELLGKTMAMFSDTVNVIDTQKQRELDAQEAEECRQIALIRLNMQISGEATEQPIAQIEGVIDALQGQGTAEEGSAGGDAALQGGQQGITEEGITGYHGVSQGITYNSNAKPDEHNITFEATELQSDDDGLCAAEVADYSEWSDVNKG